MSKTNMDRAEKERDVQTEKPSEVGKQTSFMSSNARAFTIDALLAKAPQPADSDGSDEEIEVEDLVTSEAEVDCNVSIGSSDVSQLSPPATNSDVTEDVCQPSESLATSKCHLEMTELWKKFHELETEMIITKSGRRMFPSLRISFTNLDPKANYQVFFDVSPVDNKRYRYTYHRSSWLVAGRADPPIPRRIYTHPDGPFRGDCLMKQSLSFEKVKLTNNLHDKWGYIILNSMHKYQPRVHLVRYDEQVPTATLLSHLAGLDRKVFTFPETQFIGVTAYQNQLITKLKIDSNPFAKGFRDSARITQIDRESVDMLIKASRCGYTHINTSHMADQFLPATSHNPFPILANSLASKYPSIMPLPLPSIAGHHDNIPKGLLKAYIGLTNPATVTSVYKPPQPLAGYKHHSLRFNPYRK